MAQLNGIISKLNGSAGNLTFRQVSDKTVVSEKIVRTTKRYTQRQQRVHLRLPNQIHMYQCLSQAISGSFESSSGGMNCYNKFVHVNSVSTPVFLTRGEVAGGACVAAHYQITDGSLSTIKVMLCDTAALTDIALGNLVIDADTTIAEFSNAVVNNNTGYIYGDNITFVSVRQTVNAVTGIPYCYAYAWSVTLNRISDAKLWNCCGNEGFCSVDCFLARNMPDSGCADAGNAGCLFSWIHTRIKDNKLLISKQWLEGFNPLLDDYTGDEAYERAVATYGGEVKRNMSLT